MLSLEIYLAVRPSLAMNAEFFRLTLRSRTFSMIQSVCSRYHLLMTYHCHLSLILLLFVSTTTSQAALPLARLDRAVPASAVRGGSVEIALEGGDLEGVTKLHFSDERITAEPIDGGKFRVTVPAEVPLGLVDVRAVGTWGVSNPRTIVIAKTPSTIEAEPNNLIEQANPISVGSAVEGVLGARADVDYFAVNLEANQNVVIDLHAERLDSAADGVLTLFAPDGRAIELSNGYVGKDPRIDLVAPMAGTYRIRVHDLVYNGGAGYFYRLIVHQDPVVDYAYPPIVTRGAPTEIELFGRNLPASVPAEGVIANGRPLERVTLSVTPPASAAESLPVETFLRPRSAREEAFRVSVADVPGTLVGVTDVPVLKEVEPNDTENQPQSVTLPVDVVGRLDRINDTDIFRFHGTKDQLIENCRRQRTNRLACGSLDSASSNHRRRRYQRPGDGRGCCRVRR